jgi:hypothetical protein
MGGCRPTCRVPILMGAHPPDGYSARLVIRCDVSPVRLDPAALGTPGFSVPPCIWTFLNSLGETSVSAVRLVFLVVENFGRKNQAPSPRGIPEERALEVRQS